MDLPLIWGLAMQPLVMKAAWKEQDDLCKSILEFPRSNALPSQMD